jgi:hypothetical protein
MWLVCGSKSWTCCQTWPVAALLIWVTCWCSTHSYYISWVRCPSSQQPPGGCSYRTCRWVGADHRSSENELLKQQACKVAGWCADPAERQTVCPVISPACCLFMSYMVQVAERPAQATSREKSSLQATSLFYLTTVWAGCLPVAAATAHSTKTCSVLPAFDAVATAARQAGSLPSPK